MRPSLAPDWVPKLLQILLIFGSNFGSLFLGVLELFGCLLGAFLCFLRLFWEAFGSQKPKKNEGFLRFLQIPVFWIFRALDGPLEPILAPSWGDQIPKWPPKWPPKCSKQRSKTGPKNDPKKHPKNALSGPQNGPQNGPKNGPKMDPLTDPTLPGTLLAQDGAKMPPRCPQDGSRRPRCAQDGPKMAPRWPKMPPKCPKMAPGWRQDAPRCAQNKPKMHKR